MSAPVCERCASSGRLSWPGLGETLSADVRRFLAKSPEIVVPDDWKHRISAWCTPQMMAVFVYRASHFLHARGWRRAAALLSRFNLFLHKVSLPPETCIGPGLLLPHPAGVTFSGTAGRDLTLYSLAVCLPWPAAACGGPRLGDRVTLGAHAAVMGPVSIGDDVKIAYSLRVARDVPPSVMVVSSALRMAVRAAAGSVPEQAS